MESKMHCQQGAVEEEKHIFAFSIDGANAAVLGVAGDMRNGLWLRGNRMEDVNATDSPTLNERTERANDSFHFREFRHDRSRNQEPGLRVSVCFRAFASAASLNAAKIGLPSYQ